MDLQRPVTKIGSEDQPEVPKTREQIIIGKISNVVLISILIAIGAGIVGFIIIGLVAFARLVL